MAWGHRIKKPILSSNEPQPLHASFFGGSWEVRIWEFAAEGSQVEGAGLRSVRV